MPGLVCQVNVIHIWWEMFFVATQSWTCLCPSENCKWMESNVSCQARPGDACVNEQDKHWFGAKPLAEPVLIIRRLEPSETQRNFNKTEVYFMAVHLWISPAKWQPFCSDPSNSSPPSAAYMRRWIGSALVQIMACRLFGAKPLSKPMLGYHQLDP